MHLDYATIAVIIEAIKDDAILNGVSVQSVGELVNYLDENVDGFINVVIEED